MPLDRKLDRLIREAERKSRTGVSRTQWWRMERDGTAPKRVPITGNRAVGWWESEINDWLEKRDAARHQRPAPAPQSAEASSQGAKVPAFQFERDSKSARLALILAGVR